MGDSSKILALNTNTKLIVIQPLILSSASGTIFENRIKARVNKLWDDALPDAKMSSNSSLRLMLDISWSTWRTTLY